MSQETNDKVVDLVRGTLIFFMYFVGRVAWWNYNGKGKV